MASLLELEELSALPGAALFGVVLAAGVAEPKWLFSVASTGTSSPSSEGSYSSSSSLLLSNGMLEIAMGTTWICEVRALIRLPDLGAHGSPAAASKTSS